MGWERGRYYTRSRKEGGRVVREYVGAGRMAELVVQMDALQRQKREAEAAAWREEKARLEALEADVEALIRVADLAAVAALRAAGFHPHKGQWRRKRHERRGNAVPPDRPDRSEGAGEDPAARPQEG